MFVVRSMCLWCLLWDQFLCDCCEISVLCVFICEINVLRNTFDKQNYVLCMSLVRVMYCVIFDFRHIRYNTRIQRPHSNSTSTHTPMRLTQGGLEGEWKVALSLNKVFLTLSYFCAFVIHRHYSSVTKLRSTSLGIASLKSIVPVVLALLWNDAI